MNQKKCPKCGENNPPEAVMCWACYTPLTGGAVAPATAGGAVRPGGPPGGPGAATMPGDAGGAKAGLQPWMYAVGGVVLLVILVVGAKVLMGGDSEAGTIPGNDTSGSTSSSGSTSGGYGSSPSTPSMSKGGYGSSSPSTAPSSSPGGNGIAPVSDQPFTVGAIPNPDATVGVVGIAPTQAMSPARAAGIAKFARGQFANASHYSQMQIYVFQDQQASEEFKTYQTNHKNGALGEGDFNSLADLWPRTMAVYTFNRQGRESVVKPGSSSNWYDPLL